MPMSGFPIDAFLNLAFGLALFLYGMNTMSNGLESAAGTKMKRIVELFTVNPFVGILVGALVTAIIQSSSATTVMVIGFVNAGIMTLSQALAIIMGANIGTTITGQMVSFNLTSLAPYAVILGVFGQFLFSKNSHQQKYFQVLLGFGLLFLGMSTMSSSMAPLRELQAFKDLIQSLSSPGIGNAILGLLIGTAITGIIQSSSAVTAIIVAMATEGTITIDAAFPIILGANIGTTITAMLSSIGATKTAIKAATMHLLFNVVGSVFFLLIFVTFREYALNIMWQLGTNPERQIANTHTLFNLVNTAMLFPFSKVIISFVNKIIPGEDEKAFGIRLDDRMIETPAFAIQMVQSEVIRMSDLAVFSYDKAIDAFKNSNIESATEVFETEKKINMFERTIADFLVKLSNANITHVQRTYLDNMINIINDIERIGDHADNIGEMAMHNIENNVHTSEMAFIQLDELSDKVRKSIIQAFKALETNNHRSAREVVEREGGIDELEKVLRAEHIKRLKDGLCKPVAGVVFLDIISNLERIGDHASNIALYVLDTLEQ